jgi:hypothetical protein
MNVSAVSLQSSTSASSIQTQIMQISAQITSLKRKDADGNATQIKQFQQQLNHLYQQQLSQSQAQTGVQTAPAPTPPIKMPTQQPQVKQVGSSNKLDEKV